jgi:hypothetical protein
MDRQGSMDGLGFDMSHFGTQQVPQIFGAYNPDGSPIPPNLPPGPIFADSTDAASADENDSKKRRIARVGDECRIFKDPL